MKRDLTAQLRMAQNSWFSCLSFRAMGWYMHATLSDFNYCSYKEIPGDVSGTDAAAFLQKRYSQDAAVLSSTLHHVSMPITT